MKKEKSKNKKNKNFDLEKKKEERIVILFKKKWNLLKTKIDVIYNFYPGKIQINFKIFSKTFYLKLL